MICKLSTIFFFSLSIAAAKALSLTGTGVYKKISCTPFVAPRFDEFSDQIIGFWSVKNKEADDENDLVYVGDVNEVMRSCGGAVQGIREFQLPKVITSEVESSTEQQEKEEGLFMNRANDGFIYFECGSYISVPTKISDLLKPNDDSTSSSYSFLSSLSYPSKPYKSRMLSNIVISSNNDNLSVSSSYGWSMIKKKVDLNTQEDTEGRQLQALDLDTESTNNSMPIIWEKEIVCRMPSFNQPWMLNRAKWEIYKNEMNTQEESSEESDSKDDDLPSNQGWINVLKYDQTIDLQDSEIGSPGLGSILRESRIDNAYVIQICSKCKSTGQIKGLTSCYDIASGDLKVVLLQHGKL